MRRLFVLVAFVAAIFTACENNGGDDAKQAFILERTSPSVMDFTADGGSGTITYTLATRSAELPVATATTDAEWITMLNSDSAGSVTFNVAANEGDARSATIVVSYEEQNFKVMVQQASLDSSVIKFEATHLGGTYYGKYGGKRGYNYFIILSNTQPSAIQYVEYGSIEYRFDIYSEHGAAFETERSVPIGTYKLDSSSSCDPGTIDADRDCSYLYNNINGQNQQTSLLDATLTVSESGIVADVTLVNGEVHRIVYNGSLVMEDYIEPTYADISPISQHTSDITFDVKGGDISAYYRGDWYDCESDVWFFSMIEEKSGFSGVYLILDLLVPRSLGGLDNKEGFVGEYKLLDPTAESYDYTFPAGRLRDDSLQLHAWYLYCDSGVVDMNVAAPVMGGTIKVEKVDGITFLFTIDGYDDNGNEIHGTFEGNITSYFDQTPQ